MRGRSGAVLNSSLAPTGFRGGVALTVLATTGGRHHGWQMGGALNLAPHQSKQCVERIRESLALLDVSPACPLAASAWLSVTRWVACLRRPLGEAGNGAAAARVAPRDDLRVGPPLDGRPRPLFLLGGIVVFGRGQHRWRLEPENLSQKILVAT